MASTPDRDIRPRSPGGILAAISMVVGSCSGDGDEGAGSTASSTTTESRDSSTTTTVPGGEPAWPTPVQAR